MRIYCLSELGYINEAMMCFYKVIKKFDMPSYFKFGFRDNQTGKFANLNSEIRYYNDLTPEDQKNVDAVNNFMKLTVDNDLKIMLGGNLYYELMYAKLMILFKIYNKENYSIYPDKNAFVDQRSENFIRIEKECRENLVILSAYEDLNYLKDLLNQTKIYGKDFSKFNDIIQWKIDDIISKQHFSNDEISAFILQNSANKNQMDLSKERLELIL